VTGSLSPASANARGATFTLSVYGKRLCLHLGNTLEAGRQANELRFGNQTKTTIPAADLAVAGTATVTVYNPAPGGGISNALLFTINDPPAPTLSGRTRRPSLPEAGLHADSHRQRFVSDS